MTAGWLENRKHRIPKEFSRTLPKVVDIELQANDGHDVRAHFQVYLGLLMVSASDKRHYYFVGLNFCVLKP